jgi:hypothetical protein
MAVSTCPSPCSIKYKRLLLFRNNENPSQLALFVRRNKSGIRIEKDECYFTIIDVLELNSVAGQSAR